MTGETCGGSVKQVFTILYSRSRKMNAGTKLAFSFFPFHLVQDGSPWGDNQHIQSVFLPQLNLSGHSLTDMPIGVSPRV